MSALYPPLVDNINTTIGGLLTYSQFVNIGSMTDALNQREFHDVAVRLRQIREAFSDLSQKDWAEKHGFNKTQYNNWEKGLRRIPVENAERLSDTYGLTLDFIYRGRRDGLSETASKAL